MKRSRQSFEKFKAKLKKREWAEARFGKSNPIRKKKMMESNAQNLRENMTAPERKMVLMLNELKVEHESQMILGNFIYDFHLPEYRILIEVDGDYFHGHPDKYEKKDLNALQRKIKRNDLLKDKMASGLKYTLLRFWECDIHDNDSMVKDKIMDLINEHKG